MNRTTRLMIVVGCLASVASTRPALAQRADARGPAPSETPVVTGERLPGLEHFDAALIAFMRRHGIPGVSMTIVKNGRLVYARGFGHADVERREPMRPRSLVRIASISKMITSVAVLQLVERGKLGLEDRVFDLLKLESKVPGGVDLDPRWRQITVSHLLHHLGGWDRDRSGDPIEVGAEILKFNHADPPLTTDQIIRYMLARPLDFDPGKRFAYSNFGYCLLGRAIEAVDGRSYEAYVRAEILTPMGIDDMRIGRTLLKDRAPGEVRYYESYGGERTTGPSIFGPRLGQPVEWPYGTACIEAMDAHGGWIASAVDLARLATALDATSSYKALSSRARAALFSRPSGPAGFEENHRPKEVYYASGLWVKVWGDGTSGNAWHGGLLPGCSGAVLRRFDGVNAAILINKRDEKQGPASLAEDFLHNQLHQLIDRVSVWPRGSLFPKFARPPDRRPYPSAPGRPVRR